MIRYNLFGKILNYYEDSMNLLTSCMSLPSNCRDVSIRFNSIDIDINKMVYVRILRKLSFLKIEAKYSINDFWPVISLKLVL